MAFDMRGKGIWMVAGIVTLAVLALSSPQPVQAVGPSEQLWNQTVDKAIRFLRTSQAPDGSFSRNRSLGITGIVTTGLLYSGRVSPQDPMVKKALGFLETLVNPEEGHIAGKNPRDQLKNYVTAVNVMAFAAADPNGKYKPIVDQAAHFLKELQWDEGEGRTPQDDFYGGAGYNSKSRPDLSNTQFFLDALKAAGVPPDDPAYRKAAIFVSRCQNLKSEFNDQPWAGKINDGSFIYTAAARGESKVGVTPTGGYAGYGSMTYAGLKSLIYAGVSKDDPRVKAAWDWIRKHYTVEENPGMPKGRRLQGLYYYYHTMAKCLDAMGVDYVEDINGVKHDWRKDITEALAKRQRPDGSWTNPADRWMEGDPNLVTGYCLMTLSYCKPKK